MPELDGFDFPWIVSAKTGTDKHENLDEVIRQCADDSVTIQKENINYSNIKTLFEKNVDIFIFVHYSQYMPHPVYCILCDITTPAEHGLLEETILAVSKKFVDSNFLGNDNLLLHELLLSKENRMRLKKFGLRIYKICRYYY